MYVFIHHPLSADHPVSILVYIHPETLEMYFKMRHVLAAVGLLAANTSQATRSHLPPDCKPFTLSEIQCHCDPPFQMNDVAKFLDMDMMFLLLDSLVRNARGHRDRARLFRDWFVRFFPGARGYLECARVSIPRAIRTQFRWMSANEGMCYVMMLSDQGEWSFRAMLLELRRLHRENHSKSIADRLPVEYFGSRHYPVEPLPPSVEELRLQRIRDLGRTTMSEV